MARERDRLTQGGATIGRIGARTAPCHVRPMARIPSWVVALALGLVACAAPDDVAHPEFRGERLVLASALAGEVLVEGAAVRRGENELAVRFPSDRGASVVGVTPFMPSHGHGSAPGAIRAAGGRFVVSGLMLYMAGTWEIELEVARDGAPHEAIVFVVDVP